MKSIYIDEGQLSWLILVFFTLTTFTQKRNQLFLGPIVCQMTQFVTIEYFNKQGLFFSFFNKTV